MTFAMWMLPALALAPVHTGAASSEMSMRRGKRAGAGAALLRDTMELSLPTLM